MGGRRILSDEQIEQMVEMREKGWPAARIAEWFTARETPISTSAIDWQCLKAGAVGPEQVRRRLRGQSRKAFACHRSGREMRFYTRAEDEQLLAFEAAGLTPTEIGRRLDPPRRSNSVTGRLLILARHAAIAEAAHG